MSRSDRKGRSRGSGLPYTQLFHWIRRTEAWRSLSPYTRLLYIELRSKFTGTNNGDISMSYREAEELLGCSNRPVIVGFRELQDRGFIIPIKKGAFTWKVRFQGAGRATTWRLTELPADYPERSLSPSNEFKNWQPEAEAKNKTRREKSMPKACKKHPISESMACKKHAYGVKDAPHFGTSRRVDGVKKARTSISTISPVPIGDLTRALLNSKIVSGGRASK